MKVGSTEQSYSHLSDPYCDVFARQVEQRVVFAFGRQQVCASKGVAKVHMQLQVVDIHLEPNRVAIVDAFEVVAVLAAKILVIGEGFGGNPNKEVRCFTFLTEVERLPCCTRLFFQTSHVRLGSSSS